ncbi:MAG: hypothetical protein GF317_22085 [Candidatus Lokiarchaeota archaeon]|nr:hypothetical protein [Candidatus Lokiarchaeota archaeon]MBD3202151.1 hypothetical protein [Candidatus Lokiarchaeota archaeon]
MSIDKWLSDEEDLKKKQQREELYNKLSDEKKKHLKKESIKKILEKQNKKKTSKKKQEGLDHFFLNKVMEFQDWIGKRTYLKGDIHQIETWISNLNRILETSKKNKKKELNKKERRDLLIQSFREIPPKFLDEKTRIAINKKLHGYEKNNSDNYYLRKLKKKVQDKIKEFKYYKILQEILEL